MYGKIKNVPNHQPETVVIYLKPSRKKWKHDGKGLRAVILKRMCIVCKHSGRLTMKTGWPLVTPSGKPKERAGKISLL
jgi:hypothetical protein